MSTTDTGSTGEVARHSIELEEPADQRIDRFLSEHFSLSRSRVAQLIDDGLVTVNGKRPKKRYRPRLGDRIDLALPPPTPTRLEPENIAITVHYEDEHLAVIEKPAGLVVHPAPGHETGTLGNALLYHLDGLSTIGGDRRPGIVHRLDKDTSGLMLVAKRDKAHHRLSEALAQRKIQRGYVAAAWGHLEEEEFTLDRPIGRDPRDRKRMIVREDGRRAITHFKRLERWNAAELIAIRLKTGRTHQIRVHLLSIQHPVVCDPIYARRWDKGFGGAGGRWAENFTRRAGRLFLHAAYLAFDHPETEECLSFSCPLPEPLESAVNWARSNS